MLLRRTAPALALLVAVAALAPAHAQRVYIDISGATFRPYPLAVPRIVAEGEEAPKVADLVTERLRYDLEVAGAFQVLDPRSYLASPTEGLTATQIKFNDWANVGAEGLLKGKLTVKDGTATYEVRLFNVTTAEETQRWTFSRPVAEARYLAHDAADEVVRYFTGTRGIFDTKLVFIRKVRGNKEVWISDWDGHGARRLASGELDLLPGWYPDGAKVAFTSYRDGDPDLYTVDLSGHVRKLVGGDAMYTGAAVSPDGSRIAFTRTADGNAEIYMADADGRHVRRLTDSYGVDTTPSWSPDGRRIAFVSTRQGNPHIFTMQADGQDQKRITFQGNYNQTPDWSPRGDVIAFTARDERNVFDLFTVNPDTGEIVRLTQDTGNNEEPSFSPDGHHIVFTSTRTGTPRIWIMNADGTNQRMLDLPPGQYYTPVWGPWPQRAAPEAAAATSGTPAPAAGEKAAPSSGTP